MSAGVVSAAIRSVTQASHHHRHSGGAVGSGTKHALLTFLRGTGQEDGGKERGQRANARGAMSIENELVTDSTAGCALPKLASAPKRAPHQPRETCVFTTLLLCGRSIHTQQQVQSKFKSRCLPCSVCLCSRPQLIYHRGSFVSSAMRGGGKGGYGVLSSHILVRNAGLLERVVRRWRVDGDDCQPARQQSPRCSDRAWLSLSRENSLHGSLPLHPERYAWW